MALRALRKKREGFSDLQQQYLEVVINDYGGFVPHGEKKAIAKRLGCSLSYLSQLDGGLVPLWKEEYERRVIEAYPLANTAVQLAQLQKIYEDAIDRRIKRGVALTGKDPVDVISEIRKIAQGPVHQQHIEAVQNVDHSTTFNFGDVSDEMLSRAMELVTQKLRTGETGDFSDIIEGRFSDITQGNADGDGNGTGPPEIEESQEPPENG